MLVRQTSLPGVLVIEPKVFGDDRGFFNESFNSERYRGAGIDADFVQGNFSSSRKHTLRGLHLQHPHGQGKLVSVVEGEVFDVAIDIRRGSPKRALLGTIWTSRSPGPSRTRS
jgi:dTDP-4-dehydrorhamnose 3,5-epimerase